MRKILITGGAGFIGSNLIKYWMNKYNSDLIVNLDKLTYASNLGYLDEISSNNNYEFVQVDISNKKDLNNIINFYQPDYVIHLAAESHVDNSITAPERFIYSNIVGTFHLLESCLHLWRKKGCLQQSRFIHVSTDEVYGSLYDNSSLFSELSPILPSSPYSASKAASDHLVQSYWKTYKLQTIITRCSNNFGPNQHDEKFIPTIIRSALYHKNIPIYGDGKNIRDWLYVLDHCRAIDLVFHNGKVGEIYNIGANNEWRNIDLVMKICSLLNEMVGKGPKGDYKNLITFVKDRLGHDYRYAIDSSKLQSELGWYPIYDFDQSLRSTIEWYINKYTLRGEV
jgi:dTDP-glucose 4,6-dehydratase